MMVSIKFILPLAAVESVWAWTGPSGIRLRFHGQTHRSTSAPSPDYDGHIVVRPDHIPGRPFIVGVAGGTASGKTCVVEKIVESLSDNSVAVLPQDCYYRSLTDQQKEMAYNADFNFDHPSAFDFDSIHKTLAAIRDGAQEVQVPAYDYVTHSVLPAVNNSVIKTPSIVIFEGILAFHDPRVRAMLDLKVFVDTDADTRLARRIKRDITERGRDLSGTLQQYERFVKPSYDAFCAPQRSCADVILPRGAHNQVGISMVVEALRTMLVEFECEQAILQPEPSQGESKGERTNQGSAKASTTASR